MSQLFGDDLGPTWLEEFGDAKPNHNPTIRVLGGCAIVRSGTVFPQLCVLSNQPVLPAEMVTKKLLWVPDDVGALSLLGPLPFLVGYQTMKQECTITFGLSRAALGERRNRFIATIVFELLCLVISIACIVFAVQKHAGFAMFAIPYLTFFVSLIFLLISCERFSHSLRVKKCVNGEFWISGFAKGYLAKIDEPFRFPPPN